MSSTPGFGDLPADPFGDAALPPADLFDSGGLLTGAPGALLWETVLRQLEADVDAAGWDQPARLFAVTTPAIAAARLAELGVDDPAALMGLADHPESFTTGWGIADLGDVQGHPVETLWGNTAPGGTAALVLVFEGWVWPEGGRGQHAGPPSTHPQRREVRRADAVTRDGQRYTLQRFRGSEPRFADPQEAAFTGLLPDVMSRVIGAPVQPSQFRPAQLLGRRVLDAVARIAELADPRAGIDDPRGAAFAEQLRAELSAAGPGGWQDTLRQVLLSSAVQAVLRLVAQVQATFGPQTTAALADALGRPEDGVGGDEDGGELAGRLADALTTIAAATDELSWAQVAGTPLAETLPDPLREAAWAGEDLAGTYADYRLGPDVEDSITAVRGHGAGGALPPVLQMLAALGWLPPASGAQSAASPPER